MRENNKNAPERPTLKTIAFMTGLAATTVSRALNDAPDISASTKARVRAVANQIGYKADRAGLRLKTGKTRTVALIANIEEEILGILSPLIAGASETLTAAGYSLIVVPDTATEDPLTSVQNILNDGLADGVIFTRTRPNDKRVALLHGIGFPFATHGRTEMGISHSYHDYDNEIFAYESVRWLVARNRRNIALIAPPMHLTFSKHMTSGFARGISDFGATGTVHGSLDLDSSLQRMFEEGLSSDKHTAPDGLIIGSASAAVAYLAGAEAAGKNICADFDIVSKEPSPFMEWVRPDMLTFSENLKLAGQNLANSIIAQIAGVSPQNFQTLTSPTEKPT